MSIEQDEAGDEALCEHEQIRESISCLDQSEGAFLIRVDKVPSIILLVVI